MLFGAERAKAFVDAVVAIAMTLLILPLMESVNEAASQHESAWTWVLGHTGQLFAFVLSFGIIAMFWVDHHRVFSRVERVSVPLLWITMAWLLSIVWIPVVTAMVGQMSSRDRVLISMYIGSMILTSALALFTRLYLRSHPATHTIEPDRLLAGIAGEIATVALFALALVLALLFPEVSYYALFLMLLTGPLQRLFARMLGVRRPAS
ncbi:hypothetical protein LK09_19815 [Microbacterium mangrovi]|uniref:Integral membrane protein n=1 Tax=Microbacterium mangrovi TaxID=1348253 RepID=A0A0B2A0U3_9MICO|nr:hypothetical protein LK09_19815 [Microbacterium mangrovi]